MLSRTHERSTLTAILIGTLLAAGLGLGCQTTPDSGFIASPERMTAHKNLPFKKEWYARDAGWSEFQTVYVAQVDTAHLEHMSWWQSASLTGQVSQGQLAGLAGDLRERMEKSFREDEHARLRVVSHPGPDTLVIELAIVELVPTKVWLNAIEYTTAFAAFDKGYVAIESRWRDGPDGRVIATIADGMSGRVTVFSAADMTWWGHAKNAFDAWSAEFVRVADTGWSKRVHGRFPVALVTW